MKMRFILQNYGLDRLLPDPDNGVYSPACNMTFFNLLRELVDDETKSQFERMFDFDLQHMDILAKPKNKTDKKSAYKICQFTDYPLAKEAEKTMKDKFGTEIETFEYQNVSDIEKSLEVWLKMYTNDVFSHLFNKFSINRAISYRLNWAKTFDQSKTTKEKFRKNDNDSVDVEMMNSSGKFKYVADTRYGVKMIEVPCVNKAGIRNKDVSVLIYLPNEECLSYNQVYLPTKNMLEDLSERMEIVDVDVSIPKFKIKAENQMKDYFYGANSDLTKFINSNPHINEIITKGFMEINEEHIMAAATTGCDLSFKPILKEMLVECDVTNRFAKTLLTHNFHNGNFDAQEVTFSVILPENAFITEFVMVIEGKSYKSYVKEKEEAKNEYDVAVASGRSAAHVAVSARDSNKFTVSVNVAPQSDAQFLLTYEELLERKLDQYELVINMHPGQILEKMKVKVKIEESSKIRFVKTPPIRSGNEICENSEEVPPQTTVEIQETKAFIEFSPDMETQRKIAKKVGKLEYKGFSGQFVVQYDVEVDQQKGEVLLRDGYFVHFYVPDDLPPLPKHVIFTLDTSGSMAGRKIQQLREAMKFILDQIMPQDVISILDFNENVTVYDLETKNPVNIHFDYGPENYLEISHKFKNYNIPNPKQATEGTLTAAKEIIQSLTGNGSTHMIGAFLVSLYMVNKARGEWKNHQPIIVFLTDGEPNAGLTDPDEITDIVTRLNMDGRVPIFTLSFGEEADKAFLRKLSLKNFAFSRHIYEAADASLQLQQFYKQISSPVMSNVTFKYEDDIRDVTRVDFPIYFRGCDIVMCGRYGVPHNLEVVRCHRNGLNVVLNPLVKESTGQLERFWAFLTIKQLLEKSKYAEESQNLRKKAMELALKYSFVTEVTSLVVVKPEESASVDLENAASPVQQGGSFKASPMMMQRQCGGGPFGASPMMMQLQSSAVSFGASPKFTMGMCAPMSSYQKPIGMSYLHGLCQTSVSRVVKEVTRALNNENILRRYIRFPQTREERRTVVNGFSDTFRFPGILGCIDGTQIALVRPTDHGERFFNRKHYHSRNVQIICDSDLNIINVDATYGGATHDAYIWRNCEIHDHIRQLHEAGESVWFLGDSSLKKMSRALPTTQALSFLRSARRAPPPPSGSVSFGCSAPPLPPGSQTLFGGGANSMSGTGGFTFGSFANNAPTSGFAGHTQSDGITFDNVIEQGNYSTRTPLKKDTKKDSTPKEFKANRPFIIILQSKLHDEIVPLFIGKVTAPVY